MAQDYKIANPLPITAQNRIPATTKAIQVRVSAVGTNGDWGVFLATGKRDEWHMLTLCDSRPSAASVAAQSCGGVILIDPIYSPRPDGV